MSSDRIIVVGSGAFGLSSARTLAARGHEIVLLDPTGPTPHSLASSQDISKVVRSEYWDDADYTALAEAAIDRWLELNGEWGHTIYHNVGVTLLTDEMTAESFEGKSFATAQVMGKQVERLDESAIRQRMPMMNPDRFRAGYFNPRGGYVEALRALCHLRDDVVQLGVDLRLGYHVSSLMETGGMCTGVVLQNGQCIEGGHVLLAMGAWSGTLIPELTAWADPVGHPLFHLQAPDPLRFAAPAFGIVMADYVRTGFYIFPLHPVENVVKVGLHMTGRIVHPVKGDRMVQDEEVQALRDYLQAFVPELATAPIVDSRICLYHDTHDHHFVIDRHPAISNLTVACGGSGHAFKFTSVLGNIIADVVEGTTNQYDGKFRWRKPQESRIL